MLGKELFTKVMKEDWEEVVKIHEQDRRAYMTEITSSGSTTLHLAICQFEKETVRKLVDQLINKRDKNENCFHEDVDSEAKEILRIEDNKGHSPLHTAAQSGSKTMCKCIATVDKTLVLVRDKKGQTPLYRAVHYGHKKAFLSLHSMVFGIDNRAVGGIKHCHRNDFAYSVNCPLILADGR